MPTEHLFYGEDSYESLVAIAASLTDGDDYLVIADERTYVAAGLEIAKRLRAGNVVFKTYLLRDVDGESPVADEQTKNRIIA